MFDLTNNPFGTLYTTAHTLFSQSALGLPVLPINFNKTIKEKYIKGATEHAQLNVQWLPARNRAVSGKLTSHSGVLTIRFNVALNSGFNKQAHYHNLVNTIIEEARGSNAVISWDYPGDTEAVQDVNFYIFTVNIYFTFDLNTND